MRIKFYSLNGPKKNKTFFFCFPHSKMVAKYAEIGIVGELEADFQQVPLVQTF